MRKRSCKIRISIDLNNPNVSRKSCFIGRNFGNHRKKSQNWIGIAPFAQYESKVYPMDLMQQVIDELAKNKLQIKSLLFGGGTEEIKQLNQLKNNHENVLVLAGKPI
jgi:hypothetical protein